MLVSRVSWARRSGSGPGGASLCFALRLLYLGVVAVDDGVQRRARVQLIEDVGRVHILGVRRRGLGEHQECRVPDFAWTKRTGCSAQPHRGTHSAPCRRLRQRDNQSHERRAFSMLKPYRRPCIVPRGRSCTPPGAPGRCCACTGRGRRLPTWRSPRQRTAP